MSKVRSHLLRKIARESGASLLKLCRQFRGMNASQIRQAVYDL